MASSIAWPKRQQMERYRFGFRHATSPMTASAYEITHVTGSVLVAPGEVECDQEHHEQEPVTDRTNKVSWPLFIHGFESLLL